MIVTAEIITITYKASGTGTRIGYLPGDVNNDGIVSVDDMLALVGGLEDAAARQLYRLDIDRNGVSGVADTLRLIDLFAAPGVYRATLPSRATPEASSSPS